MSGIPCFFRTWAPWLRTAAAFAFSLLFVWVLGPGIASVWAGTAFESTAAGFLLAFVLFVPTVLLSQLALYYLTTRTTKGRQQ